MSLSEEKILHIKTSSKPKILVIGDLIMDHYVWGKASRLSPEAPVPVVDVSRESVTLGGAANVAQNLIALGANVSLCGVIGDDIDGEEMIRILADEQSDADLITKDKTRITTKKTRIIVGSHQIVRVDHEITTDIDAGLAAELLLKIEQKLPSIDLVLLSDYNKGVLTDDFCQQIIIACKKAGKKVIIDPKGLHYQKYKGAFIIKPNKKEIAEAVKAGKIKTEQDLQAAAEELFKVTQATYLIVTLSEEGMAILQPGYCKMIPVKATEVFDVTGAGDTVLASLAYFIGIGLSVEEATDLANHAAAIVIKHVGSATTTVNEILEDMHNKA